MKKGFGNRLFVVTAAAAASFLLLSGFDSTLTVEDVNEKTKEALSTMGLDFWLRTPGESMDRTVYYSGGFHTIRMAGCLSDSQPVAVRPVIRLDRTGI